jgi:hypothetical protein
MDSKSASSSSAYLECRDAFSLNEGRAGLGPGGRALRVEARHAIDDVFELARGENLPTEPLEFERSSGGKPHDVIGTTYAVLYLISPKFQTVLEENGFTGWTTYPIRVFLSDGSELTGYRGLAITGRCGPIEDDLSERVILPPPVSTGKAMPGLRGMCFKPESWDGSDVFTPEGFSAVYVGERVKEALEAAKITNIHLERLSEIERTWRVDGRPIADT